ncbi:PP2C family protein-serine/threonine phosphatase [Desulfovibrio inopinatus]|uniref:PP2C family protein-serine/threonine phosphatase n=1 Tax=Desulfovibrio inopinatus TaxID=102109 RepID=UPI001FE0089F|nr:fused response regulator/phosphatase [Desulfovibrio inopinatus]
MNGIVMKAVGAMEKIPTILVIDDEIINLKALQRILEGSGFRVHLARDGKRGRYLANEFQPDLILLDVMMPGESGFETCEALKSDPRTTEIPIIFISGLQEVDFKVRGLSMGAVDYITKPFAKLEVLARVKIHIKLRQAYRAAIQEQAAKLAQIRDAQQAILVRPEDMPEAQFAIRYLPILEAGGDYYDVFPVSEHITGYFVADISGHDLGASFVTSSLKALIHQNTGPLFSVEETLRTMNAVLLHLLRDGKHLTGCYVCLNRNMSQLTLAGAGHPPPVYVPRGETPIMLEAKGDILGVFESVQFDTLTLRVNSGDRLYLYTDGLVERQTGPDRGRTQGDVKLMALAEEVSSMTLEKALDHIMMHMFPENTSPDDDVVLLGIEI